MKKRLILLASLVFAFACLFALTVGAKCAECEERWTVETGSEGYLGEMTATNSCPVCGYVTSTEKIAPLFLTKGYSYSEDGSITQHYAVNREAIARYEAITGDTVLFGGVAATRNHIALGPIDKNGKPVSNKVSAADFTNTEYDLFDVIVREIPESYKAQTEIVCCAYVVIDGKVTYIDNGVQTSKDKAYTFEAVKVIVDNKIVATPVAEKQSWEDDGSLKILTIGNSYSDDLTEYAYNVAKSAGIENVEVANLRANSCSLATHLSNAQNDTGYYMFRYWGDGADRWTDYGSWSSNGTKKISEAVTQADWDYIIFQQVSTSSNNANTYDDLNGLIDEVQKLNATAKYGWHMTWSTQSNSDAMYEGIVSAVQSKIVTNEDIDVIIPTGTTIQNARTTSVVDPVSFMRSAGNNHLNYGLGRYAAALTLIKKLTGLSIDDISYVPTADTEGHTFDYKTYEIGIAIDAANKAVANPFEVTNITLTLEDAAVLGGILLDNDDLNLTKSSYYNKNAGAFYFEPLSPEKLASTGTVYDYGRYFATKMFTKQTLPVGSVIEVSGGYKYFVESWELDENGTPIAGTGAVNSRFSATGATSNSDASAFVNTYRVVITEDWWKDKDIVAFNIGTTSAVLAGVKVDDIANIFKIYIPHDATEKNEDGAKDAEGKLYDPTPYNKPAYAYYEPILTEDGTKVRHEAIDFTASTVIDGVTYYALSEEELKYQMGFYNCTDNIQISNSNAGWNAKYTAFRLLHKDEMKEGFVIWTKKNMKAGSWKTEDVFYPNRAGEYVVKDTVNGDYIVIDEGYFNKELTSTGFNGTPNPSIFEEGEDFDVRGLYFSHDGVNQLDTAFDNFRIYVPATMIDVIPAE